MTFREQLEKLGACQEALDWVGDKTIEESWLTCEKSQWIIWVLTKTGFDFIDIACNIVERVLPLVPKNCKQKCINALNVVRKRASKAELLSAAEAICNTANFNIMKDDARYATYAFSRLAYYADVHYVAIAISNTASAIAAAAASDCTDYNTSAYIGTRCIAYDKERQQQCDILRKYFTIDQVKEAFNKLVS